MNSKPLYLQLADRVMNDIVARRLAADERVASVREFAADNQVNVNTAMKAYDWLSTEGIIYTRRGMGYFVCPGAADTVAKLRREDFLNHDMDYFFSQLRSFAMSPEELSTLYKDFLSK